MKTVITLLKQAVIEYEKGSVDEADNLLSAAQKFRSETRKAENLLIGSQALLDDRTSEKK